MLDCLPRAPWLFGDWGCGEDWFRDAPQAEGITPCIPGRKPEPSPCAMTSADTNDATE